MHWAARGWRQIAMATCFSALLSSCAATPAPRTQACSFDYAELREQELAIIDSAERILATVPENQRTEEQLSRLRDGVVLLESRGRVADPLDLSILESARAMLASEDAWDRQDDRRCLRSNDLISLFCALQFASIDVTGAYEHRRTGLQEVRLALQDATPERDYAHRLRNFNNDPRTTLADVHAVLDTAYERVAERLGEQQACRLVPPLALSPAGD